jgi:opacity protein-like surface antigen
MKINSLSLISVVSVLTCASAANAGTWTDFYIGGMVGVGGQTMFAEHKNETDSSQMLGGVIGMDLPVFRLEGEYDHFNSSDLNTNAAMVNLYAKMPSTVILPYIGAGIGLVFGGEQTFTNSGVKTEYKIDSTSAYQAMLGATIDILKLPIKFDVEGRILYAPDIYKIDATGTTPDMLQYGVRAKVRYIF